MTVEITELDKQRKACLRLLPSVDNILQKVDDSQPKALLLATLREVLAEKRSSIIQARSLAELEGIKLKLSAEYLLEEAAQVMSQQTSFSLKKVINATGIIVHTNILTWNIS